MPVLRVARTGPYEESAMSPSRIPTPVRLASLAAAAAVLGVSSFLTGCNDAQSGALIGAGIGALAGQAIGGDTEATVIGTAVGAGAGYVIGNESDKAKQQQQGYNPNYDY
jgi:hypothetical protein